MSEPETVATRPPQGTLERHLRARLTEGVDLYSFRLLTTQSDSFYY